MALSRPAVCVALALCAYAAQGGQEDGDQQGDDADDHEQLDEGEAEPGTGDSRSSSPNEPQTRRGDDPTSPKRERRDDSTSPSASAGITQRAPSASAGWTA